MKAALVSLGSISSKWTLEAMKEYFDEVDDINVKYLEISVNGKKAEILYKGEPLGHYDCIFAKGSFRYANLLKSLTILLQDTTYFPISDKSYTIAHDKLLTQLELQRSNIPMPTTYIASTIGAARSILERLNYPIIMKFPQGTQGKGVLFADSFPSASSILDALTSLRQPFIIQEFVETGGRDVRAFVIGNKVIGAYQRVASVKEIRANIHAGGTGEPVDLSDEAKRLAVQAAKSLGAEICGVDILQSHKGPVVIEINISPGLQGVTKYTGIDVADKISKYLYEQTKARKAVQHSESVDEIMSTIEKVDQPSNDGLITTLDFRGSRVLLPELVTKIADLDDESDYEFKAGKDEVTIKKFKM